MPARDTSIAIARGLAIICVVMGHASAPPGFSRLLYSFHMPLFFITAGYFFNPAYTDRVWDFVVRRFKGLYVPFVKWSLMFLLLYNFWFFAGIYNEQFGNAGGGVLHPYSWHQILQNAVSICVNMSGYDPCMAGAFWFFRALLIASIAFLLFYKWLGRFRLSPHSTTLIITVTALLAAVVKVGAGLKLTGIPQGGYRDLMGLFFFSVGYLYRLYAAPVQRVRNVVVIPLCLALLIIWARFRLSGGLPFNVAGVSAVFLCILPAIAGTLCMHRTGDCLNRYGLRYKGLSTVRKFLVYCGNNTLYVFAFHFAVFKLVNFLKLWYYGLDYNRMGYYPVVHEYENDLFWVVYTVAGTLLPLLGIWCWRRMRTVK